MFEISFSNPARKSRQLSRHIVKINATSRFKVVVNHDKDSGGFRERARSVAPHRNCFHNISLARFRESCDVCGYVVLQKKNILTFTFLFIFFIKFYLFLFVFRFVISRLIFTASLFICMKRTIPRIANK